MLSVLGWMIVIMALAGWSAFFARVLRFDSEISIPASVCTVCLVTFAGGICGVLQGAAWAAAGLGVAMFVWSLVGFPGIWRSFLTPGTVFLTLFALWIAFQVHDDRLSHNDDFNHWAVIVRNMLLNNAFPDAAVTAIDFSSYPPGSALFVYFVNRISMMPYTEGHLIFAQNLMVILLLNSVFVCMRKVEADLKGRSAIWAMLCACALLIFLYEFRALVVDVLNGIIGFAAIAGVFSLRNEPKKAAIYAALSTALGLLVKYSNMYYAFLTFAALIWVIREARKEGSKASYGLLWIPVLFGMAMVAAWYLHVQAAFGGVADTHSMNLSRIMSVVHGWSAGDIKTIARVCLHMATSLKKSSVLLTVFMNAAVIALAIWNKAVYGMSPKKLLTAAVLADAAYIGYQLMLFSAYILSFPREEALAGASYGRYNMSIMIWIIGFLSAAIVSELRKIGNSGHKAAVRMIYGLGFACVTVAALALTGEGATLYTEIPYEGTKQAAADTILADNTFDDSDKFLVIAADDDAKQVASVFHYKVNRHVDFVRVDDVPDIGTLFDDAKGYDYIIVLEEDSRIEDLLEGQYSGSVIGAYPVRDSL